MLEVELQYFFIRLSSSAGDLEQYDTAVAKCEAQMERINERRAKAAEKEEALRSANKKDQANKKSAKKQKLDLKVGNQVSETAVKPTNAQTVNKNKRKVTEVCLSLPSTNTFYCMSVNL